MYLIVSFYFGIREFYLACLTGLAGLHIVHTQRVVRAIAKIQYKESTNVFKKLKILKNKR